MIQGWHTYGNMKAIHSRDLDAGDRLGSIAKQCESNCGEMTCELEHVDLSWFIIMIYQTYLSWFIRLILTLFQPSRSFVGVLVNVTRLRFVSWFSQSFQRLPRRNRPPCCCRRGRNARSYEHVHWRPGQLHTSFLQELGLSRAIPGYPYGKSCPRSCPHNTLDRKLEWSTWINPE